MHLHATAHMFLYLPLLKHMCHIHHLEPHLSNLQEQPQNGQKLHHYHLDTIQLLHTDNNQHLYFEHSLQIYLLAFVACNNPM